jgi:hypothetical protein
MAILIGPVRFGWAAARVAIRPRLLTSTASHPVFM